MSATVLGSLMAVTVLSLGSPSPAFADGPAPCSVGGPPYPFAGFCATYSGVNTWYGSYGPGFPTDEGWGFCAEPPGSGGDYPAPDYEYASSAAPSGANTTPALALGFAFSEAEALGWWGGVDGSFTTEQAAVAGKLLYDAELWDSPIPSMDPGVLAAFDALDGWYQEALGLSGAPVITLGLVGGGATFTGQAIDEIQAQFPGSNGPAAGLTVELSVSGATFDSSSGPSDITVSTDGSGGLDVPIYSTAAGPVSVNLTLPGGLGQPGLDFFSPTIREVDAQDLAAFAAPSPYSATQELSALPTTGTVSIQKDGDDSAYYPVAGAIFQVLRGSTVEAELSTAVDGSTPETPPLAAGPYVVHEETPPPGYATAPDQPVTVVAGTNTVVSFVGATEDHVLAASLTIEKQDKDTGLPLAGASFEVFYDSADDGTFDQDLGTCTTTADGACSPPGNDGPNSLLPGLYRITETAAPAGYGIGNPAAQVVDLLAGESGSVSFGDPKLVQAIFQKTATGNINPAELSLAGAVIQIAQGSPGGPSIAQCTTNDAGTCMTGIDLVSGARYCWTELAAPIGLSGGANGCFTANDQQADQPITVIDAGKFVAIDVQKVDAADTSFGLPGAVFDLYRVNTAPTASVLGVAQAHTAADQTLVATATTGADGEASFPLQLPGYAYCAVELQAPPNYVADASQACTAVLEGTTTVPPPVTTLRFEDTEQTVDLSVFKYNALSPATVIAGATYDLYVQGSPPPSGVATAMPANAVEEPGDTWYARGTTGGDGRLSFTVPAGYAWCVLEVTAPPNYVLDGALHCSAVLTASSSADDTTIAIAETLATVHLSAFKYNTEQPDTVIPGATYELLAEGATPPGTPTSVPHGVIVPPGDSFWTEGTTDANGVISFAIPAGFAWCLHELIAPPAYEPDPAFHCTAVLTTDSTGAATTIAVPEIPATGSLPFTGLPTEALSLLGAGAAATGGATLLIERRRRNRRRTTGQR